MTFSEWMFKKYGIEIKETQIPLPTDYIEYKKYCRENDLKEEWYK